MAVEQVLRRDIDVLPNDVYVPPSVRGQTGAQRQVGVVCHDTFRVARYGEYPVTTVQRLAQDMGANFSGRPVDDDVEWLVGLRGACHQQHGQ